MYCLHNLNIPSIHYCFPNLCFPRKYYLLNCFFYSELVSSWTLFLSSTVLLAERESDTGMFKTSWGKIIWQNLWEPFNSVYMLLIFMFLLLLVTLFASAILNVWNDSLRFFCERLSSVVLPSTDTVSRSNCFPRETPLSGVMWPNTNRMDSTGNSDFSYFSWQLLVLPGPLLAEISSASVLGCHSFLIDLLCL